MINIGNFYFNPQLAFMRGHFFLGVSAYWGGDDGVKYLTFHAGILNLSLDINMGIRLDPSNRKSKE